MTNHLTARRFALLGGLLATSLLAAACGSSSTKASSSTSATSATTGGGTAAVAPAGGAKPLIYAIYKQGTQQYFVDQATGAQAAADKVGAQLKVVNVESDGNLAVTAVQNAIAAGAKGIAITVPDQTIGPRVAELAAAAHIPLVATDDSIKDGSGAAVAFVGFDGKDMGKKTGDEAVKLLTDGGWLKDSSVKVGLLSVEKQDLSACNDRTDAQKAAVKAAGVAADRIYPVASDASVDGALSAASPVITAAAGVTNWVVTGCNDESVQGGLKALAAAGVSPDKIIAVGLGAYLACKDWKAGTPTGFKASLYISGKDVGDAAINALYANIAKGTALPPVTVAKTSIVDPSSWQAAGVSCT